MTASSKLARSGPSVPMLLAVALTFVLLGILFCATPAHSESEAATGVSLDQETIAERIDAFLQPLAAAEQISGGVLVAHGEETVYERSFGMANRELEVPVSSDTRFNIASITKPMTQIITLKLVDQGLLTPEDAIAKWLPGFPRGDVITVEMLAWHKAGIPHRVTTDIEETQPMTAAEVVERAAKADLLFEPGSDTAYSSAGYTVLARVLELASGQTYPELLDKYVFGPASMTDSIDPVGYELVPERASSYQFASTGELVNSPARHYSFLEGAGSVYSTARDLVRLMQAVVDGDLGPSVSENLQRDTGITWNGRTDGYRAFADYHPDSGIYIAFANNIITGAGDLVRQALPRIAAGESVEPPTVPRPAAVAVDPEILERYAGDYQLRPGSILTLSVDGNEVRMSGWLLIPTSKTTFFSPQDWAEITVVPAENGSIERLDWTIAGKTYPLPRVEHPATP